MHGPSRPLPPDRIYWSVRDFSSMVLDTFFGPIQVHTGNLTLSLNNRNVYHEECWFQCTEEQIE